MPELAPDDPRRALFGQLGFDKALAGMSLVSVEPGRAVVSLPVTEAVCNPIGTLHGGCIATLVDDAGTIAIMSSDAEGRPGVTTDLTVSYLSAAPLGETVTAEGRTLKSGRTLAFVEVDIRGSDGKLLATGRMTKFMGR
jgi:acyl-coenzyme A thioesterase 13